VRARAAHSAGRHPEWGCLNDFEVARNAGRRRRKLLHEHGSVPLTAKSRLRNGTERSCGTNASGAMGASERSQRSCRAGAAQLHNLADEAWCGRARWWPHRGWSKLTLPGARAKGAGEMPGFCFLASRPVALDRVHTPDHRLQRRQQLLPLSSIRSLTTSDAGARPNDHRPARRSLTRAAPEKGQAAARAGSATTESDRYRSIRSSCGRSACATAFRSLNGILRAAGGASAH
jgi:hypothetical protein